ncbi:MAG: hypothetical protein SWO11_19265 [Thermodesulfobacteriota bacterium]|nr:hypothetical protein [Thermodesulfobacteriota bacterium]
MKEVNITKQNDKEHFDKLLKLIGDINKQIELASSWQYYTSDLEVNEKSLIPLGFHKAYGAEENQKIIELLNMITVFPHYCLSFYSHPEMDLIIEEKDGAPAVFQSDQYHNIGRETFVKSWGCFMMYIGWPNKIINDIDILVSSAEKCPGLTAGHDMITDLWGLKNAYRYLTCTGQKNATDIDFQKEMGPIRRLHEKYLVNVDDYDTFLYVTRPLLTSIELSPETQKNIASSDYKGLVPLCQIPFGLGGYRPVLERDFGYDKSNILEINFLGVKHPLFAVTPGIFGYESGAFYDPGT